MRSQEEIEKEIIHAFGRTWQVLRKLRTPSQKSPHRHAPWSRRILAATIDLSTYTFFAFIGYYLVVLPVLEGLIGQHPSSAQTWLVLLLIIVFVLVPLSLLSPFLFCRKNHNGQTWGKKWVGVRVTRDDGLPWKFRTAV